ncbi:hypothetical protein BH23ACT11_BH23ACT11_16100 [soil metagenome]
MDYLLDATALLAWLNEEPGGHEVEAILDRTGISTVNLSETLQKSLSRGVDVLGLRSDLEAVGISPVPFEADDAESAAALWLQTRDLGLLIGDRTCLATALKLELPAVTADKVWAKIVVPGLDVMVIR